MFSDEYTRRLNRTSRGSGAVGANAVVPQAVAARAAFDHTILDFGAGRAARHTERLRALGFSVTAYEIGDNVVPGLHDPQALRLKYDVVYASNVLNVHSELQGLQTTLDQIAWATDDAGIAIMNIPKEPQHLVLVDNDALLLTELQRRFHTVDVGEYGHGGWLFTAKCPRRIKPAYSDKLGKRMGHNLYVHARYAREVFGSPYLTNVWAEADSTRLLDAAAVVKFDPVRNTLTFINSANFDTAHEPHVDSYVSVGYCNDGIVTAIGRKSCAYLTGHRPVYHHKWMMVSRDYSGFDTEEARHRSMWWTRFAGLDSRTIGTEANWSTVLARIEACYPWETYRQTMRGEDA